eukprot:3386871-Pyramimonas_sp.AAC.1
MYRRAASALTTPRRRYRTHPEVTALGPMVPPTPGRPVASAGAASPPSSSARSAGGTRQKGLPEPAYPSGYFAEAFG